MIIVRSKAKQYAKEKHGMRLSTEFLEILDEAVCTLIDAASDDAKKSKVGTVKGRHLPFIDLTE